MPEIKIFAPQDTRKQRIAIFLLFTILAAILILWTWSGELNDFGGDSAAYLLMSRLYSPYHSASQAVMAFKSQNIYPPLFPLLLAIVDGGYHFFAAHLLIASCLLLSAFAVFVWLRKEGLSIWLSVTVALVWCLIPANLLQVLNIWTEYPYIFCSLAVVVLLSNHDSVIPLKNWYWAAAFVVCASLIRAAALPLCFAFLAFALLKQPRKFVPLAIIAMAPFLAWAAYSGHNEQGGGSYVKQLIEMYSEDPVRRILHQFALEFDGVKSSWQWGWVGMSGSPALAQIPNVFAGICIIGWLYRLIKLRFDAIYVAFYLGLLFVWAHPEEASRYALVLYPIFVASGFLVLAKLAKMLRGSNLAQHLPFVLAGILIIVLAPNWILYTERYLEPVPDEISTVKHSEYWYYLDSASAMQNAYFQTHLFHDLKGIGKDVAPNECIFAIKPTIVTLFSDRTSFIPPKVNANDQEFDAGIQKCHYAYVLPFASPSYPAMLYPLGRLGQRAKLISQTTDAAGHLDSGLVEIAH